VAKLLRGQDAALTAGRERFAAWSAGWADLWATYPPTPAGVPGP